VNGATFAAGKVGQAFQFDGSNDYISAPDNGLPLGSEARTMEFWMQPAFNARVPVLYEGFAPNNAFYVIVNGSKAGIGNWGGGGEVFGTTDVTDGAWHHVALTYDGTGVTQLYVDGALEATASKTYNTTSRGTIYFGSTVEGSGEFYTGPIDEISIYDRALDASEIQSIFTAGSDGKIKPPGEIHGTLWHDLDGNGTQDACEPGLAGWTVYLDLNNNGVLDAEEPTAVTQSDDPATTDVNEAGTYAFTGLEAGTYTVRQVGQPGWHLDPGAAVVTLAAGQVVAGIDFANLADDTLSNTPPTADAGGPYTVPLNGSIQLNGARSTDSEQAAATLTYLWDLDGDGIFGETGSEAARGDEIGSAPIFSAAGLADGTTVTVALRVIDEHGLIDEATATIDVSSTAVFWTGGGDFNWFNASNWSTDIVPGAADDVVINVPGTEITVTMPGSAMVHRLLSEEGVSITVGSLTVTGESIVNAPFILGNSTSLTASGAGASFTANGATSLGVASLFASSGGIIDLHMATSYAGGVEGGNHPARERKRQQIASLGANCSAGLFTERSGFDSGA
jgi:hypothetical protein